MLHLAGHPQEGQVRGYASVAALVSPPPAAAAAAGDEVPLADAAFGCACTGVTGGGLHAGHRQL
jgi:hypothetical protein